LDWSLTERFALRAGIPSGFEEVRGVISEIDVIWIDAAGNRLKGFLK
jgi:hypothetical protein